MIVIDIGIEIYWDSGDPFSEKAGEMENICDMAEDIDQDRFINYEVIPMQEISKEMIAVVFNTDEEFNVGLIDEYGNVIREPFMRNKEYDYNRADDDISVRSYHRDYLDYCENWIRSDENGNTAYCVYNKELEEVLLSTEWDRNRPSTKSLRLDLKYSENTYIVDKVKEYIVEDKEFYVAAIDKRDGKETIYEVTITNGFADFYILLDENLNLINHLYYYDGDENQFAMPKAGSKVGCAFVRNVGLVYYNLDGDIIWITYCR